VQRKVIQRVLGLLLALFSVAMLPPALVAYIYDDSGLRTFLLSFVILLTCGTVLVWSAGKGEFQLKLRDGYMVVVLFWTVLGSAGSVPLLVSEYPQLSLSQAIFESMSALTTTGATVVVGLDYLPKSLLFYRQLLQWLGGMGVVVLAIAILPALGIGGRQLFQAESSGVAAGGKLTPRIGGTAKALWLIYCGLTVSCTAAYFWAGMDLFDSISHAFSTVAIGGFSTHDQSIGFFDSQAVEWVAIVFMLLSGVNFGLHFVAWRRRDLRVYRGDSEFKTYIAFLLFIAAFAILGLLITTDLSAGSALRDGVFHAVSMATTTGFSTTDYYNWAGSLPLVLLSASFVGGCAGSTGGGLKVMRVMLLLRQGLRELKRMLHPNALIIVKLGNKRVPDRQLEMVWGFFSAYVGIFVFLLIVLVTLGLDQVTAFSSLVACMNNLGPGLGEVGGNYSQIDDVPLLVMCLAMLMGRLEIFTLLVLFTPYFWRK